MRRTSLATAAVAAIVPLAAGLPAVPVHAAFRGSDGRIVFSGYRNGQWDLFTVRPDGADRLQLTNDAAEDRDPAYSADGGRIVWSRGGDIWMMHADGSHAHRLTGTSNDDVSPAFSPSGHRVVWSADGKLRVVNADGTHAHGLGVPGVSPPGRRTASGSRTATRSTSPSTRSTRTAATRSC